MKRLSAAVKVGILFALLVAGSYGVWKTIGQSPSGESGFEAWARFTDASGLPEGSRVVVAGLPIGEISGMRIDGRYARLTLRIRDDVPIFENAIAIKKSSSLLGDFFIELDPGSEESIDALGKIMKHGRLKNGDQIVHVIESTSIDQVMRKLEASLPKVDAVLLSVRDLSEDVRGLVNGPLASTLNRLDRLVQDKATTVGTIIDRTDRTLATIEDISKDIRLITRDADAKVDRILANIDKASADASTLVTSAQREVEETGAKIREKLDGVDEILEPSASVMKKVDEDKGTLGRLVNDPTIADNIEDITEDAKGFLGTLFGMQSYVGLRSEMNVISGLARHYVSVELHTRPDKFYYIELEKGPRGDFPETTLTYDHVTDRWRQDAIIRDKIRFTFQFAKKIDWLTLRYGLKESSGGIGVDAEWFDRRLKLSTDVFDATFDRMPRLKLTAAVQFFSWLYILGGVDDALNHHETLLLDPIDGGVSGGEPVPAQFNEYDYGRDYFLGAQIRFNDLDLAALLTVGGAALSGAMD
jgi:phospholipid/cholesterol/gamma-HCH transport system substrate-binding protein